MLNTKEIKAVVTTLSQRRAQLRKSLEGSAIDESVRQENVEFLRCLDSAMQKLAALAPQKPKAPAKAASAGASEKRGDIPFSAARVLVAEDSKESSELLLGILEDMGIKNSTTPKMEWRHSKRSSERRNPTI